MSSPARIVVVGGGSTLCVAIVDAMVSMGQVVVVSQPPKHQLSVKWCDPSIIPPAPAFGPTRKGKRGKERRW